MKKISCFVSLMLVAFFAAAAPVKPTVTDRSTITLQAAGQGDKPLNFMISTSWSDAEDSGFDSEDMNGFYVIAGSKKYMRWCSNQYSKNLKLGFNADITNTSYTMHFSGFEGTLTYTIYDAVADVTIEVNASTPDYAFTIDPALRGTSITDRFVINYNPFEPDEGELSVCFNEEGTYKLEVKNNPFEANIVVKDGDTELKNIEPRTTPQVIDLSDLAAGKYTVVFGNGARTFVIVK